MSDSTDTRTNRPSPLYAALGATDILVERLRSTNLERDTERLQQLLETRVQQGVAEIKALPEQMKAIPDRAQAVAADAIDSANAVYTDLAARGELLVARIRSQKSTRTARAEATATSDAAEATTESARATAESTVEAAAEAAEKVGD